MYVWKIEALENQMSMTELLTLKEASNWASKHTQRNVTTSNISYLIQYGKVKKYGNNGTTSVDKIDLIKYYQGFNGQRESDWKEKLGADLNWSLSFDYVKEKDTTKHVHRLHPYKGKFIPQLVEYFLDEHTDGFKKEVYFNKDDIILDPFCGSGTTMVQGNELGIHVVGLDISAFNALISNVKVSKADFQDLSLELNKITAALKKFISQHLNHKFESDLLEALSAFNKKHFPSPEYKIRVRQSEITEKTYATEKSGIFLDTFNRIASKYEMDIQQNDQNDFLSTWLLFPVRKEIDFVFEQLKQVNNPVTKKIIAVVLSRTIRSCRATTHADLATLKEPVTHTYYCKKHGKICKPLFSILSWWERYSKDTISRLTEFAELRTNTYQTCVRGDSRVADIFSELTKRNKDFAKLAECQKIRGIFSSPPYVGLIDYHEQHAYAYDLFGFDRNDELEIGPLYKGQGKAARESYIEGIAQVLSNSKRFMQNDYDVFLVANDKYSMYPTIARKCGMQIVNQYKRPVLNRTEKDKGAYAETIFHLKERV